VTTAIAAKPSTKLAKSSITPDQYPQSRIKERTSPVQHFGEATPTFKRERPTPSDPAADLNADQQALELRLREWRKSESERMGLPQFFVLGTTALRSIVLSRPRTLSELREIGGIDREKLDKFGPNILKVCNA
jgi:ATP-dependent DNA helicase RecQ